MSLSTPTLVVQQPKQSLAFAGGYALGGGGQQQEQFEVKQPFLRAAREMRFSEAFETVESHCGHRTSYCGPLGDHTHTLIVVQLALKQELQRKQFPPESIGGVSSSTWPCSLGKTWLCPWGADVQGLCVDSIRSLSFDQHSLTR